MGHGHGQRDGVGVASGGEPIHRRPARVAQAQELGALVERLPRCVVARLAEQRRLEGGVYAVEGGVAAAGEQRHEGVRGRIRVRPFAPAQVDGQQVTVQVVDPHERLARVEREGLGELDAHQQRAREPRAVGHGDRVDVGQPPGEHGERLLHHGHDALEVRARGDLGHHASIGRVQPHLARHHIGQHFAIASHQRSRGLVARALDAEDYHKRFRSSENTPK